MFWGSLSARHQEFLAVHRLWYTYTLEFSASLGFVHKESVTMYGHMILKFKVKYLRRADGQGRRDQFGDPDTVD
jgi:hypothetical protein